MSNNFKELVLAGYQGWFATPANNIIKRWSHWCKRGDPQPGGYTSFELYPDLSEYKNEDLHETGYADLHGGGKSLLYDSDRDGVVGLHFQWMEEYGLDGIALQRFLSDIQSKVNLKWRNSTALRVKKSSEAAGKFFYIMYDITNYKKGNQLVEDILDDVEESLKKELKLLDSPGYARQDGRPVIAIWGLGFPHIHKNLHVTKEDAIRLIRKLQDSHGCYVAGGVPYCWRLGENDSIPGWLDVYKSFDMLIPWSVGRYPGMDDVNEHFERMWKPDKEFCAAEKIDLQRVIYPGFAWSNKKEAIEQEREISSSRHLSGTRQAPQNQVPRLAGKFFWRQAFHVANLHLDTGAFIAMFDEFDEGTVIAKAAKNKMGIPKDQYFLTLDADKDRLSSDFYLRIAAEAAKMIKGLRPITEEVPVSHLNYKVHVSRGYPAILGRGVDPDGLKTYVKFLETGGTLLQFCQQLADSDEFKNNRQHLPAKDLAAGLYQEILKRPADPGGLESKINAIKEGKIAQQAANMLSSQEFFDKFM
ncbi:MAG: DUF4214 domain-containing protein [Candidatus Aminicenantes bacterium]|jgi:hypothetical protein